MTKELTFSNQTLFLITRPSLQSCALAQNLKKLLKMDVKIINIHIVNIDSIANGIILFDLIETDKRLIKGWQEELCKIKSGVKLLLFNAPEIMPILISKPGHISAAYFTLMMKNIF